MAQFSPVFYLHNLKSMPVLRNSCTDMYLLYFSIEPVNPPQQPAVPRVPALCPLS